MAQVCISISAAQVSADWQCVQKGDIQAVHRCFLFSRDPQTYLAGLSGPYTEGRGPWYPHCAPEELCLQTLLHASAWCLLCKRFRR